MKARRLLLLMISLLVGCSPQDISVPDEQPRGIALSSIYSTNGQEGLKPVKMRLEEPYGHALQDIYREFQSGLSNVFLVRGSDITAAVKATRFALLGGRPGDVPIDPEDGSKGAPLWVVAYFGTMGSGPPGGWLVESVAWKGKTVRVKYLRRPSEARDSHQYLVWIPLGLPEPGSYAVELFDTQKQEVTLRRGVKVVRD